MRFRTKQLALACALACATLQAGAEVLAFPGAVGFGAAASGGRNGTVVHVTNLNDSGPGSFRDAVSAPNRFVIFDVGGYIVLKSPVSVYGNITIAGQTAPGDGVGIMGGEVSLSNKTNIIVRGLRVRQGLLDPQTGKSAIGMANVSNMILDHISVEYGQWDSIDAVKAANFTVQNSIIANPIGQQFGAHVEGGPSTFYRNLWVNGHNRQPLSKDNTQYINNIVTNYQAGYTVGNTGGKFTHDLINNYFVAGPSTTTTSNFYYQVNANQTIYATGNYADTDRDGILDGSPKNTVGSAIMTDKPWADTTLSIPTIPAADAFYHVAALAGVWPRDAVDQFAVNDSLSAGKTGILYKNQANTGLANSGYGILNGGTPQPDLNADGIPDYWAQAYGIGLNDAAAARAGFRTTGYTNLEAYVNSLILPELWTGQDLGGATPQGASTFNALSGQWVLTGSGTSPDASQFASRPWTANGIASARIDALASGQTGLLIRNPAASNAAFVALSVDAAGMLRLSARQDDGANVTVVQRSGAGPGTWIRLQQNGSTFTAYTSSDGASWIAGDSIQANLGAGARAGIAIAAADAGARAAATLSNVTAGATLFQDLTASVKFTQSGFTLNRSTGIWTGTVTITNTSSAPLAGTLLLRLDSLTSGVVLGNAGALQAGAPLATVPVSLLAPGASSTVTTSFSNTNRVAIGYVPKLYSGTL